MSTVFIIGAGASHGESLRTIQNLPAGHPELHPHCPPLTNGFFDEELLAAIRYPEVEKDYAVLISYIREGMRLQDDFGQGAWKTLNLEELLTSLEIQREFEHPDSDDGARLLLLRNLLLRYLRRILGLCTQYTFGEYYHSLVTAMRDDDSVITFNWDLLLDLEFIGTPGLVRSHYTRFLVGVTPPEIEEALVLQHGPENGLFLKLHGSLNWYRCGNQKCRAGTNVTFESDVQACLSVNQGIGGVECSHCGSDMHPIIVPPLLRKPITDDPVIRSAWGLARSRLLSASRVIVIGFSAAPTDFYTSWLLRSTVGARSNVRVFVINPSNRREDSRQREFRTRMSSIFLNDYDSSLSSFSDIGQLLQAELPHI